MSEQPKYSPDYEEKLISRVKSDLDPKYMNAAGMAIEEDAIELAKKFVHEAGRDARENPWIESQLVEPSNTQSMRDAIFEMLEEKGSLSLSVIKKELEEAGFKIPGKGTEANLIGYLNRDPRFIKISRGTYGLQDQ